MKEETRIFEFKPLKKYIKSPDFKNYYVTGAIGGFRNPYDFRLSFFNVDSNEFVMNTQNLKDKKFSEKEFSEKLSNVEMNHTIVCELIMTEKTAREIYNFLGKELELLEDKKKFLKQKLLQK
ncbi:MAG: hypothetical protein ACFFDL_15745 [Promethearchaeota archaeon]